MKIVLTHSDPATSGGAKTQLLMLTQSLKKVDYVVNYYSPEKLKERFEIQEFKMERSTI